MYHSVLSNGCVPFTVYNQHFSIHLQLYYAIQRYNVQNITYLPFLIPSFFSYQVLGDPFTMSDNNTNAAQQSRMREALDIGKQADDASLVSICAHNKEEILRGTIGGVFFWCYEAATWLVDQFYHGKRPKARELIDCLKNNTKSNQEKHEAVLKWMDELKMTLHDLICIFQAFKAAIRMAAEPNRIQWKYKGESEKGFVVNIEKCETWFRKVSSAEESVKCHELSLTLDEKDENSRCVITVLLNKINQTRNRVLHHNTHRPCLRLDDMERGLFIKCYTAIVNSGILSIFSDDDSRVSQFYYYTIGNSDSYNRVYKLKIMFFY